MADLIAAEEIMFRAFEPKLKMRYSMSLNGLPAFLVKTMARPSISFEEVELHHMNVKRYVHGKATWEPIEVTLYDPVVPSAAQGVMEWIRLHHESVTGRDGYSDFYKKDINILTLGPVGDVVEEWILKGCYVQNANFGDMDWTSEAPANINITMVMDYAILNY